MRRGRDAGVARRAIVVLEEHLGAPRRRPESGHRQRLAATDAQRTQLGQIVPVLRTRGGHDEVDASPVLGGLLRHRRLDRERAGPERGIELERVRGRPTRTRHAVANDELARRADRRGHVAERDAHHFPELVGPGRLRGRRTPFLLLEILASARRVLEPRFELRDLVAQRQATLAADTR